MKKEEKIVPIGFNPPRNVAAIPLKPIPGTDDCVTDHCSYPERKKNAAPIPARAPPIKSVRITFLFSFIPLYFAASLAIPVALIS